MEKVLILNYEAREFSWCLSSVIAIFMKRKFIVPLIILLVLILVFFIAMMGSALGISGVRTDKSVYKVGERINISYFDFRIFRSNKEKSLLILRHDVLALPPKYKDGWVSVRYPRPYSGRYCVDGVAFWGGVTDMLIDKFLDRPFLTGSYIWEQEIQVADKDKTACEGHSYITQKGAPTGNYKVTYGDSKKFFKIE